MGETDTISRQAAIDALDCINGAEEVLRALPSVQPDHVADISKKVEGDCISRQAAIDAVMRDVSCIRTHEFNAGLTRAANRIKQLPSVQPELKWIPCSERLPENDNEVLITVWDAEDDYVEVYKGFYQGHEWWTQWCHGCSKIKDEPCGENIVIAWMPLPKPYWGGDFDE